MFKHQKNTFQNSYFFQIRKGSSQGILFYTLFPLKNILANRSTMRDAGIFGLEPGAGRVPMKNLLIFGQKIVSGAY